jgi:alginate O-acetyltransferase complex protein AlgI
MLFTDPLFLFGFLPVVLVTWLGLRWIDNRKTVVPLSLIGFSWLFYSWSYFPHLLLLIGSIIANWIAGLVIAAAQPGTSKVILFLAVTLNLTLIAIFKYADFLTGHSFNIVLPLAISFFTFQQISYVCDAYRYREAEPKFLRYAFVVSFFPHLISGPIVRYREIRHQLKDFYQCRTTSWNLKIGIAMIILGLGKKVLLADSIAPLVDEFYARPGEALSVVATPAAMIAAFGFYLQIYFDFSGYTDIAIGLARLFNIRFPNNFNYPYRASSISDFWRRWHITLSRFLRDYLYIPLGGGRVGLMRLSLNLMITMVLGGLWHGAAWKFVIWGALHGLALVAFHLWRARRRPGTFPAGLAWCATQAFVVFGWILFRAPDVSSALSVMRALVRLDFTGDAALESMLTAFYANPVIAAVAPAWLGLGGAVAILAIAFLFATVRPTRVQLMWLRRRPPFGEGYLFAACSLVAAAIWIKTLQAGRADPFIYFQF